VRALLRLADGDRVVAWSPLEGGGAAAATEAALVVGDGDDGEPVRLPWHRIAKARWADGVLEVVGSPAADLPTSAHAWRIAEEGRLVEAVRTLVTGSVLWSQRIEAEGAEHPSGAGAWLAARRSGASDEVAWTVIFDPGLDPTDATLRRWADDRVARVREQTGL
jgi:hypothetical protein